MPTPFDLIFRRFLPKMLQKAFKKTLDSYELRHRNYDEMMDVPNLSGCFVLFRLSAVKEVGFFDPHYFMYLEDTDLCRRVNRIKRTVYYPYVSVIHGYAKESYKNPQLLSYHIRSAIYYFNKWGWIFDAERKQRNKLL